MTQHEALAIIQRWEDSGQPCPINKPSRSEFFMKLVDDGLVRFVGMERLGPLALETGSHCYRLTAKGHKKLKAKEQTQ